MPEKTIKEQFPIGSLIEIVDEKAVVIDTCVVIGHRDNNKITVRSKELQPEAENNLSLQENGLWKVLNEDPFTGRDCISLRGPSYGIRAKTRLKLEIPDELWYDLARFLNRVADEREQESDGPGSFPSYNATAAREMLKKLGMERIKGQGVF